MTWRKGWSRLGVSKVLISVQQICQYSVRPWGGFHHAFAASQLAPQSREGTHERIVLQTPAFLTPGPPFPSHVESQRCIFASLWSSSSCAQRCGLGSTTQDSSYARMCPSGVFSHGAHDSDTFCNNEADWVDGHSEWYRPLSHEGGHISHNWRGFELLLAIEYVCRGQLSREVSSVRDTARWNFIQRVTMSIPRVCLAKLVQEIIR